MSILNISWDVHQKVKISMRFLTFSIDFQFWTKRSRASRLSVLVIFEGEVRRNAFEGRRVGGSQVEGKGEVPSPALKRRKA